MMQYYRDADSGAYVRHPFDAHKLEIRKPGQSKWLPAPPDSSYERELYLGSGSCLFPTSREEAEGGIPSN